MHIFRARLKLQASKLELARGRTIPSARICNRRGQVQVPKYMDVNKQLVKASILVREPHTRKYASSLLDSLQVATAHSGLV